VVLTQGDLGLLSQDLNVLVLPYHKTSVS